MSARRYTNTMIRLEILGLLEGVEAFYAQVIEHDWSDSPSTS